MAITTQETTTITGVIEREGMAALIAKAEQLNVAAKKQEVLALLSGVVTVTVSDWTTLTSVLASGMSVALPSVLADILTALANHDTAALGPLGILLVLSAQDHFGVG